MVFSSASLSLLGFPLDIRAAMEKAFARDESCGFGDEVYSMLMKRLEQNIPLWIRKKNPQKGLTPPASNCQRRKEKCAGKYAKFLLDFGLSAQILSFKTCHFGNACHCRVESLAGCMVREGGGGLTPQTCARPAVPDLRPAALWDASLRLTLPL